MGKQANGTGEVVQTGDTSLEDGKDGQGTTDQSGKTELSPEEKAAAEAQAAAEATTSTVEKPGDAETEGKETPDIQSIIKSIKRDDAGNFVWVAEPGNQFSAVFKGKSPEELMDNIANGIREKDAYVRRLKAERLDSSKFREKRVSDSGEPAVEFPNYDKVLAEVVAEMKLDPAMLTYDEAKWAELEASRGALAAFKANQLVEQAQKAAQARYAEKNVLALNALNLDDETDEVQDMLEKAELDAEAFDYESVLAKVYKDPENFNKNGIRRPGRIVKAAHERIIEMTKSRVEDKASRKLAEGAANARAERGKVGSESDSGGRFKEPTTKALKSINEAGEATERALRNFMKSK